MKHASMKQKSTRRWKQSSSGRLWNRHKQFRGVGLNDPYGPRGDIRPRARHSQAGVSQLSNGTAPVLGGIRSHRQGGGGTEGAQGHPRAHLRHASREEGWSRGSRGLVLCNYYHTNCTNRDTNRYTNCCEIHTNHTNCQR